MKVDFNNPNGATKDELLEARKELQQKVADEKATLGDILNLDWLEQVLGRWTDQESEARRSGIRKSDS